MLAVCAQHFPTIHLIVILTNFVGPPDASAMTRDLSSLVTALLGPKFSSTLSAPLSPRAAVQRPELP